MIPEQADSRAIARHEKVLEVIREQDEIHQVNSSTHTRMLLKQALATYPEILENFLNQKKMSYEGLIDMITSAAIENAAELKVLDILYMLLKECRYDNRGLSVVPIDSPRLTLSTDYILLFAKNPRLLIEIQSESLPKVCPKVLEAVQKENGVPLFSYRKDLILRRFILQDAPQGAQVLFLPTRIPDVDVQLLYPQSHQLPQVSFLVNPI